MNEEKVIPTETQEPCNEAEAYKQNADYIKGNRLYRVGWISLAVVMILICICRLFKISVVIGGLFINSILHCVILLPLILMVAGLFQTCRASKNCGNYNLKSNRIQTGIMLFLTLVLTVLCVLNIVFDNYRNAQIDEVTVNGSEPITVVISNTAANSVSSTVRQSNIRTIEVFKSYGIFKVPVVSATVNGDNFDYSIEEYSGDEKYIIKISEGTSGQMYPFNT